MSAFKVGDRVRYVGGYTPFYVSPKPNAEGTVVHDPCDPEMRWYARVLWDDRLRYRKEDGRRDYQMKLNEVELIP